MQRHTDLPITKSTGLVLKYTSTRVRLDTASTDTTCYSCTQSATESNFAKVRFECIDARVYTAVSRIQLHPRVPGTHIPRS